MKIVFLSQASSNVLLGGAEIQIDLIINEFLNGGHDIFSISDRIADPKPGRNGVTYLYLKSYGRRFAFLNFFPLFRLLKNLNPDLIYQRWRIPYTGIAAFYVKKYSKKMVFSIAGENDVKKNKYMLNPMLLLNIIKEGTERYGLKHADLIIAQTYDQKELLKKNFCLDCIVVPNGHPVPKAAFEKSNPPIVLWVANIKPLKRLEIFLDLAKELSNIDVRFCYVGRFFESKYKRALSQRAENLKNVTYLGELSLDETNEVISRASVLVNTSYHEGFPNTFIQAWMRETPVVSLNVNPDQILTRNEIGYCSQNFDCLVRDVRTLLTDAEKRQTMGSKARKYAIENHDIKNIGRRYEDIFRKLIR